MSSMDVLFTSAPSGSGTAPAPSDTPELPDNGMAALFEKALAEGEARHDLESGGTLGHEPQNEMTDDSSGDTFSSMFSAMSSMSNPVESLFSSRTEAAAPTAQSMDTEALEKIVDRILVSTPAEGGHEVRISLNDSSIRGTEIILQRGTDGALTVMLNTTDASSFQTLVSARNDLQQALEKHEGAEVRVVVDQNGGESNDSDRRSRGWIADEYPES